MSRERRIHNRIPIEAKIKELYRLPHGHVSGRGIGKDLSTGGMCILCTEHFERGQRVLVNFTMPDGHNSIRCEAQVRWVSKDSLAYLVGVQFLHLKSEDKKALNAFVRQTNGGGSFFVRLLAKMTGR